MKLKLAHFILGPIQTNTFAGVNEETGNGFLVDPAVYDERVDKELADLGITNLQYIFLTHGHFDHILGVNGFLETHPEAKVVISENDAKYLTDSRLSHSAKHGFSQEPIRYDVIAREGERIPFDDITLKVIETPGHTAGSVVYLLDDIMFAGDTLFQGSCGRTDFEEGSAADMQKSLARLKSLEGNYTVLPGHGPFTTLDDERKYNPYMK